MGRSMIHGRGNGRLLVRSFIRMMWTDLMIVSNHESCINGGFIIGLAQCRMGHKIKAGSGIQEILRAGYGMKIVSQVMMLLFQLVGCGIVLKLMAGSWI